MMAFQFLNMIILRSISLQRNEFYSKYAKFALFFVPLQTIMSKQVDKPRYISTHEDTTYDHVLKYTGVFGGVQGLKILVMLLRNKLTASLLHAVGMGLNAVYMNIAEIINSATNFGISFSAVRETSQIFEEGTEEQMKRYVLVVRTWCVWTAILASVLCLLSSPLLSYLFFQHDLSYTPFIILLSLMLFVMPIEAGECAILKGMRKLKVVATIESIAVIATLLTTIPLYYFWGIQSVVYSLVLTRVVIALIHLYFSVKVIPYHIELFSKRVMHEGIGLIKLGIPYVLASLAGALSTAFIFGYLEDHGQIGLYKAGYSLMVTCAGMVYVAVEADYFPRLSSVCNDVTKMNKTINQQIDVCLMLVTPLLIAFILLMPIVIPLLLSNEFLAVVPMCTLASFYMFFRGIAIPLEYTALAKGDSIMYLIMELIYDTLCVVMMRIMYDMYGLVGAGLALSLTVLVNIVIVYTVYHWKYKFHFSKKTLNLTLFQLLCLGLVVGIYFCDNLWVRYSIGGLLLAVSSVRSFHMLSKESSVISRLLKKFRHNNDCNCC